MKEGYRKLGDLIQLVDERNQDLAVTDLVGLSISKEFIPSVANTIGSDMGQYKIIRKNQFACSLMQVRRDKKIPVALQIEFDKAIISQAYPVFEVKDSNELLPEYLMMWFSRKEFDREATFHAVGGVRGSVEWEDFADFELPVPSPTEQQKIIDQYHSVENKIKTNEAICGKLEAAAQALYKHWFVDFEFPNEEGKPYQSSGGKMVWNEELEKEIPEGWEGVKVKHFCEEMKNGATPSRDILEYWFPNDIPWIKTGEVSNNVIFNSEEYISELGFENSSTKLIPKDSILMAMYGATAAQLAYLKFEATTNQACCAMICSTKERSAYLYHSLLNQQKEIENMAIGGAQQNLSKQLIEELDILQPDNEDYFITFSNFIELKAIKTKENQKLRQLQGLLLSGMVKAAKVSA
ncbi:MAG: restriction endonuclease subunit S [Flavobacteriia bacterium]|nr:restriction endonuclease subunit S [Flavobacteriia bacterium]